MGPVGCGVEYREPFNIFISSFFVLRFGISRQAQDEFALRSHQNSAKAHADGIYTDEVHMIFNQIL